MKNLKNYFVDSYIKNVIIYDLYYKVNYHFKFIYLSSSKFIYLNQKKYNIGILSRIYKILRVNYTNLNVKITLKRKYYLKGRKVIDQIKFMNYLYNIDFLLSFNYLCFYIYRIFLNYNGLFLVSLGISKINRNLILFWNDFPTRLEQLNESLYEQNNSFFKIELYKITLNLYLNFVFEFIGSKSLILLNFIFFFGFYIPKRNIKLYQYFIRII